MVQPARAFFFVACAIPLVAGTKVRDESGVSPVQKVLMLLENMAAKVETDLKESTRNFELFAKACGDDATAKENAISDSQGSLEEFGANIQAGQATVTELETEIQDLASQISEGEAEFKSATEVRKKEKAEFVASEKELVETVDSLAKAESTLKSKKGGSFAQLSVAQQGEIMRIVKGFGMVVEGAWISHAQKATLKSFLQQKDDDDGEDDLTLKEQPASEEAGPGILDTIADMLEKAEDQLSGLRKAEMEAQHEFQMLAQGTQNQIEALKKDLAETTGKKQVALEGIAQNQKDSAMESKVLQQTQGLLRELKRDCQSKAGDFETETTDSQGELEALGKAKEILSKKFAAASFLQLSSRTTVRAHLRSRSHSKSWDNSEEADMRKEEALHALQGLGKQLHSTALVSLALRAAQDPFAKVRTMIEEMVAKLLSEAAEEADQKAFCDKEIGESKTSQDDKQQKLDTVDARMGKLDAREATLAEEVSKITAELTDIDTAMREATEIRTQGKADFQVAAKDFRESQEACSQAITVLREYYEGASSFLQTGMRTRARAVLAEDTADQGDGEGIIGLLEVAESDFATMLAQAKATEDKDQSEYQKLVQDNKVLRATKIAQMKAAKTDEKVTKSSLDEFSQDKEGLTQELSAVNDYLSKLKPQCETKAPAYAEIKARRDREIEGLKTALETLEG